MGGPDSDLLTQIRDGFRDLPERLARALAYGPSRPQAQATSDTAGTPGSAAGAATSGPLGLTFGPEWDAVKGLAGALGAFSPLLGRVASLMGNLERLAGAVDTFGRVFKLFGGGGAGEEGPAAEPPWAVPVPQPPPQPPPPPAPTPPTPQPPSPGPAPASPVPSPLSDEERAELERRFPGMSIDIERRLREQAETPEVPPAPVPPPVPEPPAGPAPAAAPPAPPPAPEPPAGPAPSILSRGLAPGDVPAPAPVPRSLLERPLAPVPPAGGTAAPEALPPPSAVPVPEPLGPPPAALPEFFRPEDLTRAPWEVLRSAQASARAAGLGTTEANAAGWAASQHVREQGTSPAVIHARELQRQLDAGLPREEAEDLARAAGDRAFAARTPVPAGPGNPPEVGGGLWPSAGGEAAAVPGSPGAEQSAELLEVMGDLKESVAELAKAVKESARAAPRGQEPAGAGEKTPERIELPPNAGRAERGGSEGPDKNIDFARQLGNVLSTVAEIAGAL